MSDRHRLGLLQLSDEYLAAAQDNLVAGRPSAAFAEARHAAELAGKALLQQAQGSHPQRRHNIAGAVQHAGLMPDGLDGARVSASLGQHTRGEYHFDDVPTKDEVEEAIEVARRLSCAAAREGG